VYSRYVQGDPEKNPAKLLDRAEDPNCSFASFPGAHGIADGTAGFRWFQHNKKVLPINFNIN